MITYRDDIKNLPTEQLYRLFEQAGWVRNDTPQVQIEYFNAPFLSSTLVVSAWEDARLVGSVRVLSDGIIRSSLYDLVVDAEYRMRGIGAELVRRCRAVYPNSEWLLQAAPDAVGFYEKLGFAVNNEMFLSIPSIYQ